ncbi:uncharacterized protein [Leptinotarsa decemlineata]|uniref:uncharacterized protein n=1 Tax=Leptinotarsa decemlineata TaxID=7539 RepID=UPI003D304FB4
MVKTSNVDYDEMDELKKCSRLCKRTLRRMKTAEEKKMNEGEEKNNYAEMKIVKIIRSTLLEDLKYSQEKAVEKLEGVEKKFEEELEKKVEGVNKKFGEVFRGLRKESPDPKRITVGNIFPF